MRIIFSKMFVVLKSSVPGLFSAKCFVKEFCVRISFSKMFGVLNSSVSGLFSVILQCAHITA